MAHKVHLDVLLMFLPHFDVMCDKIINGQPHSNMESKIRKLKLCMVNSAGHLSSNRS